MLEFVDLLGCVIRLCVLVCKCRRILIHDGAFTLVSFNNFVTFLVFVLYMFFFFLIFGVAMGLILFFRSYPDALPAVTDVLKELKPVANATFYWTFAAILGAIYVVVLISRRFDYWEVRPNELLHHTGLLSDLKRYSAPNLRIDKEINDVFEFMLLRSGTLILHPSQERRAIVLENIPNINRTEEKLTQMLGALQVQVRKAE